MQYVYRYQSVLGEILLAADEIGLQGLWFKDQKYFGSHLENDKVEGLNPVLEQAVKYLDDYFSGKQTKVPPLHLTGTVFQEEVWNVLLTIPYGSVMTYGEIAAKIAKKRGLASMSAQAVGGAVGHNPVSIIVPCHRVIGTNGSMTGYAGGIEKKQWLLAHEKENKHEDF